MFESEERFGFSITILLSQKGAQSKAAMMPHDSGRVEGNDASGLLQAPAKIDIIAGGVVLDVETADLFKRPPVEGHVTARDMLRDGVGEQNMSWTIRRRRDIGLYQFVLQRRAGSTAYCCD